jgi:hypothetical protein
MANDQWRVARMSKVPHPNGEFVIPAESERWTLWAKLHLLYYLDPRYQNIIRRDLGDLWRAYEPFDPWSDRYVPPPDIMSLLTVPDCARQVLERAERAEQAHDALRNAIRVTTRDTLRLTWEGEPLAQAMRMLQRDVIRSHLPEDHPDRQVIWYEDSPRPLANPEFILCVAPTLIRLAAPGMDLVQDQSVKFGRFNMGFGQKEWDEVERRAIEHVRTGVRQIRARFEETYDVGPRRRPSTVRADNETLTALFRYLFHRQAPAIDRRRLKSMAAKLGIDFRPR